MKIIFFHIAMELPVVLALVASFVVITSSHPKNSDIIPKEYYKRQILQPIPGYIPVYIKADGEPLLRRESKKPIVNVHPQKAAELKEKNLLKHAGKILLENQEKSARNESDEIKTSKKPSSELQKNSEMTKEKLNLNESSDNAGNSQVKVVAQEIQTVS